MLCCSVSDHYSILRTFCSWWKEVKSCFQTESPSQYSSSITRSLFNTYVFRTYYLFYTTCLRFLVRIIWCCVHLYRFNQGESSYNDATFLLERIGSAVFFTSYTIVLFYWLDLTCSIQYSLISKLRAEISGRRYVQASGFLPRLKWIFIITNIIVYLAVITFAIVCMLEIV